jgi:hypothetical protein
VRKKVTKAMIAYDLQCQNGHTFEGWFEDSKAFKKQQKAQLIACPVCDDTQVTRIPSTFAIRGTGPHKNPPIQIRGAHDGSPADSAIVARAISDFVEKNFDNVGPDFATEALKMHFGVKQPRNIRGVSTHQEEETLRKEGVEFVKFPVPVRDPSSSDA